MINAIKHAVGGRTAWEPAPNCFVKTGEIDCGIGEDAVGSVGRGLIS